MKHSFPPFNSEIFATPPAIFRPLQITHGLDRFGGEAAAVGQGEVDPAGQWAERLESQTTVDIAIDFSNLDAYLARLAGLGLGGIVTNVGFEDYLDDSRQWAILRHGLRKAIDLGLRVWLYDEKGYPSGTAGGIVTRANPELAALGLACYVLDVTGPADIVFPMPLSCHAFVGARAMSVIAQSGERPQLNEAGGSVGSPTVPGEDLSSHIDEWHVLRWTAPEGHWRVLYFAERVMYEGTHSQGNVCEFKHYINLLDPAATRAFLRVTHEAYARELSPDLWATVEAIFTDEPSLMTYYVPALPERYWDKVPVVDAPLFTDRPPAVPWTHDFLAQFQMAKGYDLRPYLYLLFFDDQQSASSAKSAGYIRQDYYDVLTTRYAGAFYGQVLDWCQSHGIASSGHILLEENLCDHVAFHGSLFAALRKMDLPGIDMLNCDPVAMLHGGSFMGASFMAVKQVTSVAHLTGAKRIHSESSDWEQRNYGNFASLAERRGQANLQYVLGVNQITSYFGWTELGDEAQRQYHDYVGRLGVLLTGGRHVCDVAVLYPIRTLWAHYLPPLEPIPNWAERQHRSEWILRVSTGYNEMVKRLLCAQVDVDIIDEEAIVTGGRGNGVLCVADEVYRVIVLPPLDALALATAQALAAFCEAGGILLSVGPLPTLAECAENTPAMCEIMDTLFGNAGPARIVALEDLPDAIYPAAIPPDLTLAQPNPDVLYTHRILGDRHVYFIINNTSGSLTLYPSLREAGPYILYRPLTGEVVSVGKRLQLELEGFEGVFVVST
ncbi:MAG: hypothetical protein JXA33_13870 [Anaerolineae bacterium]|nr:hypothetical protein [Anaerolineae bacterium]